MMQAVYRTAWVIAGTLRESKGVGARSSEAAGSMMMYKKVLLASDGTLETLVTLREGALIARALNAKAHLLIIDREDFGRLIGEGFCAQPEWKEGSRLLSLGLGRLKRLGVTATGEIVRGDPSALIAQAVGRIGADLVVLGHRRQRFLERWWSGSSGAYIVDGVSCSVLIARDTITDEEFETYLCDDHIPSAQT